MRFALVDRIVRFESKKRICALKGLTLSEEYLADHFPGNPVMPGVLMLEAMVQAGSWLLRAIQDFSYSVYAVKEVTNVKYAKFLMPSDQLLLQVDVANSTAEEASLSGVGTIQSKNVVSARWVMRSFNLAATDPRMARNDQLIVQDAREKFRILGGEESWKKMAAGAL